MRLLTLRSILVATDLGNASRSAVRTAARLAPLAEAALHLLHVTDNGGPDERSRLRQHFYSVIAGGREPDSVAVLPGDPAEVIVEQAIELNADAIILGPHRGVGRDGGLGSTAARVVRTARCPCLVAATELRLPLERVLAPIDLSATDLRTLSVALSWASALRPRHGKTELTALHITTQPTSPTVEDGVREEVQRARDLAGGAAQVDLRERIASGSEADKVILQTVVAEGTDLLVMGTRGTAAEASTLGSVSTAVARSTPCPLLLVPPATSAAHAT